MSAPRRRRPREDPLTYLLTWLGIALALFWPLLLGPAAIVVQPLWLALCAAVAWGAWTGRRKAARERRGTG